MNTTLSLLATLKAKPGKEKELAQFLKSALPLVQAEPGTFSWYALQIDDSTFGIFDTFKNEEDRNAHLSGEVAKALISKAGELLSTSPDIRKVDILAFKSSGEL